MYDTICTAARASVVWMIGAYHHLVPNIAPDALRELAKSFKTEDAQVKLQVLNLATKLFLSEPATCEKLFRSLVALPLCVPVPSLSSLPSLPSLSSLRSFSLSCCSSHSCWCPLTQHRPCPLTTPLSVCTCRPEAARTREVV